MRHDRYETALQRRQRMAETAAREPINTPSDSELDDGTPLWAPVEHTAMDDAIVDLVDHLPANMRAVVELRIWGRLTFDEIADELGMGSRGQAHVVFTRALERLKIEIGEIEHG